MGLLPRGTAGVAVAEHARVSDGEHLWLGVRGADSLVLTRAEGPDLAVPTEPDGDLRTAVFPLAAALADTESPEVELQVCHGQRPTPVEARLVERPATPTLVAPSTRDGRWQLSVHVVDGTVVVRRTAAARRVALLGLSAVDGGVALRLAVQHGQLSVGAASLRVIDGVVVLDDLPGLVAGTQTPVLLDGVPVVRSRNVLARPHFAVTLPPLPDPRDELRWLKDGRLAVVRREAGA